jgi:hypothetical protein
MPTTYNDFQDKQEEFWKAVREQFEDSETNRFNKFFVPLFYIDELNISDSSNPLNLYGADRSITDNIDALRAKITYEMSEDMCPGQLLRYMFEEEDHSIYEALVTMLRTYRDLGNTIRAGSDTDTDTDSDNNN